MKTSRILFFCLCLAIVAGTALAHFTGESDPRARPGLAHTLTGDIRFHKNFYSRYLHNTRDLIVYLPPEYESSPDRRFAVLYMQDGQNIFDQATSFYFGRERHVDETAEELIQHHQMEPVIIVGIDSVLNDRINEYTPTEESKFNLGGHADDYGRMLIEEVKPFIDERYRTLPDRSHTALGGSSLGGLVTAYLGLKYAKLFGKISITSPAAYWDNEMIVRYVNSLPAKTDQRICLTIGTSEKDLFLNTTRDLHNALLKKGWKEGPDFGYLEATGREHAPDEAAERTHYVLKFLFPSK